MTDVITILNIIVEEISGKVTKRNEGGVIGLHTILLKMNDWVNEKLIRENIYVLSVCNRKNEGKRLCKDGEDHKVYYEVIEEEDKLKGYKEMKIHKNSIRYWEMVWLMC